MTGDPISLCAYRNRKAREPTPELFTCLISDDLIDQVGFTDQHVVIAVDGLHLTCMSPDAARDYAIAIIECAGEVTRGQLPPEEDDAG